MGTKSGTGVCGLAVLMLAVHSQLAGAQNGYSFIEADTSAIDYRVAGISPIIACREFAARSDTHLSVITAQLIPADGNVGEHCRVDGLIAPEVRFQVNLPSAWNGRFYMHGNGGYGAFLPTIPAAVYIETRLSRMASLLPTPIPAMMRMRNRSAVSPTITRPRRSITPTAQYT